MGRALGPGLMEDSNPSHHLPHTICLLWALNVFMLPGFPTKCYLSHNNA